MVNHMLIVMTQGHFESVFIYFESIAEVTRGRGASGAEVISRSQQTSALKRRLIRVNFRLMDIIRFSFSSLKTKIYNAKAVKQTNRISLPLARWRISTII